MSPAPNRLTAVGLKPGDKLDKYEVLQQIGSGGMSVVWKAYDALLGRFVAVKQLNADSSLFGDDEALRERFRSEFQTQKRIASGQKHLVHVLDLIEEPRGIFIVMEFVEGASLEQLLEQFRAPMEQRRALGIIGATALSLQTIHQHGVVHRDLKPANVLLPTAGGLKVCDFGLASLVSETDSQAIGTVKYMAPELFAGGTVSARSDMYSLGVIAYEMLAGRDKFDEAFKIVVRDQRNQALRWMKWHTNPRAAAPPLSQLVPEVPQALSDLVARLMDKDADKRVSSAGELIEAIRRHFAGVQPAQVEAERIRAAAADRTAGSTAPTAAVPRRSKLPLLLAASLGLMLAVFAVIYALDAKKQGDARRSMIERADADFRAAESLLKDQDWSAAEQALTALAAQWPDHPKFGRAAKALAAKARAESLFARKLYAQAIEAFKEADGYGIITDRDGIQNAIKEAERGLAVADAMQNVRSLVERGKFNEAREARLTLQRSPLLLPEEKKELDDLGAVIESTFSRSTIAAALAQANDLIRAGQRSEAQRLLEETRRKYPSQEIDNLLGSIARNANYERYTQEAALLEQQRQYAEAIDRLERAGRIRPSKQFEDKIQELKSKIAFDRGLEFFRANQASRAYGAFKESDDLWPNDDAKRYLKQLEATQEKTAFVRAGDDALARRDWDTAIEQYKAALDRFGPDPAVSTKLTQANVARTLVDAQRHLDGGRLDQAKSAFDRVTRLDPQNAQAQAGLAEVQKWTDYRKALSDGDAMRKDGRYPEAQAAYRRAREIAQTDEVQKRMDDAEYESNITLARAAIAAEQWASARAYLSNAVRTARGENELTANLRSQIDSADPPKRNDQPAPPDDE